MPNKIVLTAGVVLAAALSGVGCSADPEPRSIVFLEPVDGSESFEGKLSVTFGLSGPISQSIIDDLVASLFLDDETTDDPVVRQVEISNPPESSIPSDGGKADAGVATSSREKARVTLVPGAHRAGMWVRFGVKSSFAGEVHAGGTQVRSDGSRYVRVQLK